jgi:2-isopropylmalate synthase
VRSNSAATRPTRRAASNFNYTMTAAAGRVVTAPATATPTSSRAVPARPPTAHDKATGRDPQRVKIFDTTLRDGEQSPGATLTPDEKLIIARQLAKLGVDVIEAGFPIASDGDFEAVQNIARVVGNRADPPIICGLARALKNDIKRCWEAVQPAAFPRIHTFIATSDVHMEHKLRKTREQVLAITTEVVTYARSLCEDVEFSAEDAIRSDRAFLCEVFSAAIAAGATTINVPDTVGYTTPAEFADLIQHIRASVVGVDAVTISVHGHDDLGMAVANFLAAVEHGARQVEVTINGIGERAGNASLEEVVMALHVRGAYYNERMCRDDRTAALTNINQKEIYRTSRLVSNLTGMMVQPNKAIVGANAFAHESGIHQDGVLKKRETYEIMDATSIGLEDNSIVLGKLSGRHAFGTRLIEMGYELTDDELQRAFVRFKEFADKKKDVSSLDIEAIVDNEVRSVRETIALKRVQVQCGDHCVPTATMQLHITETDATITASCTGTGPVDAAFKAVNEITKGMVSATLKEYMVNSVTKGIDALGEVTVRVEDGANGRQYTGRSAHADIVVASAQAYINAINRCRLKFGSPRPIHPQHDKSV